MNKVSGLVRQTPSNCSYLFLYFFVNIKKYTEVAMDLCPCDNIIPYETVVCKGEGGSLSALLW